jgi:hypothetical protein
VRQPQTAGLCSLQWFCSGAAGSPCEPLSALARVDLPASTHLCSCGGFSPPPLIEFVCSHSGFSHLRSFLSCADRSHCQRLFSLRTGESNCKHTSLWPRVNLPASACLHVHSGISLWTLICAGTGRSPCQHSFSLHACRSDCQHSFACPQWVLPATFHLCAPVVGSPCLCSFSSCTGRSHCQHSFAHPQWDLLTSACLCDHSYISLPVLVCVCVVGSPHQLLSVQVETVHLIYD